MHTRSIDHWQHDHTFGQDIPKAGERRTLVVIVITAITMAVEIFAGIYYGSMALLADGLHMGSHASALVISAFAYYYTRKHARDARFNFGTGKVNSLAAFASAVLLVVFALIMAWESLARLVTPVPIQFDQAILVAVLGLVVNGACLVILRGKGEHDHHGHGHDDPGRHDHHGRAGRAGHEGHGHHHGYLKEDHNLWAAYIHVLADALTSLLAIFALLAGKYFDLAFLDPLMGVVGAVMVANWSVGLLRLSSRVLLDMQAPRHIRDRIRAAIEAKDDNRLADMHVWSVGPNIYAAELVVVSSTAQGPDHYCRLLPPSLGLVHVTIGAHECSLPENP